MTGAQVALRPADQGHAVRETKRSSRRWAITVWRPCKAPEEQSLGLIMEQVVPGGGCIEPFPCGMHHNDPALCWLFPSSSQALSLVSPMPMEQMLSIAPSHIAGAHLEGPSLTSRQLALAEYVLADEVL